LKASDYPKKKNLKTGGTIEKGRPTVREKEGYVYIHTDKYREIGKLAREKN